ncbi:GNAT family N-acetyltransferase [Thalassospira povalilytica]|uniref:GNAT family N-acetyltransferase n=1 Tax=Thalassospira povalilytica TaxID=732237 RepID=UPI003AA8670A
MSNRSATLASERLSYAPVKVADIGDLFVFLGDVAAMRFTHCDQSLEDCQTRLLAFEARRNQDGFAPWVVRQRETDRIIGWGGLYIDPFDPDWGPEIGYFLHPDHHGRGFGRELAETAIAFARARTSCRMLGAFAHPDNHPSAKLLSRLGFVQIGFVASMNRNRFRLMIDRA